ncbi:hypothetical protein LOC68_17930 [Blastopirellula sp. JC732]|uniref:Uncharacterized protein n=1 Tax=Blastopirellula sediminis TaxID=2894196 RepID=A0A9X1MN86_9BACT|nr:hypothetical protein [Blastopirellula sediminis]MCC9630278.1 hypothetical protein [Blastopirellula sediminis]
MPMAYAGPPGGFFGGFAPPQPPTPGYRSHSSSSSSPSVANDVLSIVGGAFGAFNQANNNQNHNHNHAYSHNNGYSYNNGYNRSYQPRTVPAPNVIPSPAPAPKPVQIQPKKNKAPVVTVKPKANVMFTSARFLSLTAANLQQINDEVIEQQENDLDEAEEKLKDHLPPDEATLLDQMNNSGITDRAKKMEILDAVKDGDADRARRLWVEANGRSTDARELEKKVDLQNQLNELRERNRNGDLSRRDLKNFANSVRDKMGAGRDRDELMDHLDKMADRADLQDLLNNATPNAGTMGLGSGSLSVIYNPNMPEGKVVNLGNGTVMVGTDRGELEIGQATLAEALGMKVAQGEPEPESDAKIPTSGVVLRNSKSSQGSVSYVVNSKYSYEMQPGHIQSLGNGPWTVAYDRGGSFGEAKYTLDKGTYEFRPSENGWNLYAKKFEVVIDNSGNPGEFHYVVNNVAKTVASNSTQTHTSEYPIEVRFDRGDGNGTKRKVLSDGRYEVAVSPQDNLWDLYSADAERSVATGNAATISLFGND